MRCVCAVVLAFVATRYENLLIDPWMFGYKHTVLEQHHWKYYDIDLERCNGAR
jgi:hypothetical protein